MNTTEVLYKCVADKSKEWFPKNCNRTPFKRAELIPVYNKGKVTNRVCPYCRGKVVELE
jgi:hypothetical protein